MVFNSRLKHWSFFLTSASPRMTTVLLNTVPFREDTKQKQGREGPPLQTSQLQVSKWSLIVPHKANRWLDMWQVQGLLTRSHPTWGSQLLKNYKQRFITQRLFWSWTLVLFLWIWLLWRDKVVLCILGQPGTHYVVHAGLELTVSCFNLLSLNYRHAPQCPSLKYVLIRFSMQRQISELEWHFSMPPHTLSMVK